MNISLDYIAGFFDGEGCIDCQRMYPSKKRSNFYVRPRVRLSQTASCAYVLDQMQSLYGGFQSSMRRHENDKRASSRASYTWELLGRDAIKGFLGEIEPLLILKREQAKLCLWWFENMSGRQPKNGYQKPISDARKAFAEELKMMKSDPQRLSEAAVARIESLMR